MPRGEHFKKLTEAQVAEAAKQITHARALIARYSAQQAATPDPAAKPKRRKKRVIRKKHIKVEAPPAPPAPKKAVKRAKKRKPVDPLESVLEEGEEVE